MLESAVGAVGYVIRKLNAVRESDHTPQPRFEAIEIIEAVILALVAVATAWSGVTRQRNGLESVQSSTPRRPGFGSLLKALLPWQDRSGSTTATPSIVGSPRSWMVTKLRSSLSGAFATSTDRPSWLG